ncbi:hypothetical protein [Pyxidicoccus xibeiensis]|uniref:hypothetical protein n=1 Tax=Pyxidicoccus xibeiensis TaxID=2906759 RepID=UPI0020A77AC4|nr:hypothetical protein [Pyxidicoccus xibeiensis]MCP3141796.1 hypothetical protein [Pyxidicoccus xibeiensis]
MNRINSLNGPRVQPPTTQATQGPGSTGFGARLNGGLSAATPGPGDPLMASGGAVVASALASVGSAPHTGLMNTYLGAIGRGPIAQDGSKAGMPQTPAEPGSEQAKQEQVLHDLATLSAATLGNAIIHMGNKNRLSLDT